MKQLSPTNNISNSNILSRVKSGVSSKKGSLIEVVNNSRSKIIHKSMPTILADDLKIEGTISSLGIIEVEGYVNGIIEASHITIRERGSIEGEIISLEQLNIKGKFDGSIKAKQINIFNKAEVNGSIEYEILSVEDGASIDGQFKKTIMDGKNKDVKN